MDLDKKVAESAPPANTTPIVENRYLFKVSWKIVLVLGLTLAGCWMTVTGHGSVASDLFTCAVLAYLFG